MMNKEESSTFNCIYKMVDELGLKKLQVMTPDGRYRQFVERCSEPIDEKMESKWRDEVEVALVRAYWVKLKKAWEENSATKPTTNNPV